MRPRTIWIAVVPVCVIALVWSGERASRASAIAESEHARLVRTREAAAELRRLSGETPAWALRSPPSNSAGKGSGGGLTSSITETLQAAGMPAACLASLSPTAEIPAGSEALHARRRRTVITLAPITLPQAGTFLAAWREREPDWTVAAVELAPEPIGRGSTGEGRGGAGSSAGGGDLPLRAVLTVEALYVNRPPAPLSSSLRPSHAGATK